MKIRELVYSFFSSKEYYNILHFWGEEPVKKGFGKAVLAAAVFIGMFLLGNVACDAIYRYLEGNTGLLCYYASDGAFQENLYFSSGVLERTGADRILSPYVKSGAGFVELAKTVSGRRWELALAFARDQEYLDYLSSRGSSLDEVFLFCERLAGLRDGLSYACHYMVFLVWVIFLHFLVKFRPGLYFGMGLLCIVASVFKLSDKLFAALFLQDSGVYQMFAVEILPTLLEAMLTFLIFDITFAFWEKLRNSRKLEPLYRDLPALCRLTAVLLSSEENRTVYRSQLSEALPNFAAFSQKPKPKRRGLANQIICAVEELRAPHNNEGFLRGLINLQALLPPK